MGITRNPTAMLLATLACGVALTGCVDATNTSNADKPSAADATSKAPKGKTTEVSAPEIFAQTDRAVWDGRPTLGGIWVAHEGAKTPARVTIVNTANGATIEGALWSKSSGLPGPAFTISSDLAEALKMQAGVPADLKVVALKTVVAEAPKPQETEAIAATPLDDVEPEGEEKVAEPEAVAAADAAEPKPEKKKFSLFKKKSKPAADAAVVEEEVKVAEEKPAPAATPTKGASYAQVGLFSNQSNANALVKKLDSQGLGGVAIAGKSSSGKPFWRVLAGPAKDKAAESKLLADVKALGFKDAYLVKG